MWQDVNRRISNAINGIRSALFGKITSTIQKDSEVFVKFSEEDEVRDIKIISPYGFASMPIPGLFGEVIFNNSTKKAFLVGVDNKPTPITLEIGEVLIYNKTGRNYIQLKNNGDIVIVGKNILLNTEAWK